MSGFDRWTDTFGCGGSIVCDLTSGDGDVTYNDDTTQSPDVTIVDNETGTTVDDGPLDNPSIAADNKVYFVASMLISAFVVLNN